MDKPGTSRKKCKTKSQDKQKVTNESKKKDTDDTHQTNYAFSIGTSNKRWISDTEATTSISPHTMPERPTPGESITMANGDTIPVTGVTRAKIGIPITTVLCVPEAYRSLLFIGKACEDGDIDSATFNVHGCKLYKAGQVIATGDRNNGLYELHKGLGHERINLASASIEKWHQRLAHSPLPVIKKIVSKHAATGIELSKEPTKQQHKCEACELG